MSGEYGPFLVLQLCPPLKIPLRVDPESGLLLHARTDYTKFATTGEAEGAIKRDQEEGAEFDRVGELKVMLVSEYEESRIPVRRARKPPRQKVSDG